MHLNLVVTISFCIDVLYCRMSLCSVTVVRFGYFQNRLMVTLRDSDACAVLNNIPTMEPLKWVICNKEIACVLAHAQSNGKCKKTVLIYFQWKRRSINGLSEIKSLTSKLKQPGLMLLKYRLKILERVIGSIMEGKVAGK